jgi:hypothetical protein
MCTHDDGRLIRGARPSADDVAHVVGADVVQAERSEALGDLRAAQVLGARGRRNLRERDLRVDDPLVVRGEASAGRRETREEIGRRGGSGHVASAHALSMACRGRSAQVRRRGISIGGGAHCASRIAHGAHQRPRLPIHSRH